VLSQVSTELRRGLGLLFGGKGKAFAGTVVTAGPAHPTPASFRRRGVGAVTLPSTLMHTAYSGRLDAKMLVLKVATGEIAPERTLTNEQKPNTTKTNDTLPSTLMHTACSQRSSFHQWPQQARQLTLQRRTVALLENRASGSHSHGDDTRGEGRHISNIY